jgi:hypothetical protein
MTTLVKLTITKEPNGSWSCTRERATNGETATGLRNLEEVFEYVKAHELTFEAKVNAAAERLKEKYPEPLVSHPWVSPEEIESL